MYVFSDFHLCASQLIDAVNSEEVVTDKPSNFNRQMDTTKTKVFVQSLQVVD